jgi:hypothetical protein
VGRSFYFVLFRLVIKTPKPIIGSLTHGKKLGILLITDHPPQGGETQGLVERGQGERVWERRGVFCKGIGAFHDDSIWVTLCGAKTRIYFLK